MATKKPKYDARKALLDYSVNVPLGAGQLVVEKARLLFGKAWTIARSPRETTMQALLGLAHRGEELTQSIRRSAYTKAAVGQVKTARSQTKAATTSLRKAAGTTATATKAAAKKVG
ncbi:MAG: hypothetical protein ACRDGU_03595 [Actinomycetota bacterium]